MSVENLNKLIGERETRNVIEMGGVMSIVFSRAVPLVVAGKLTLDEGVKVFEWAVKKEAELKSKTLPLEWQQIVRDSMSGMTLAEWGKDAFIERCYKDTALFNQTKPSQ